VSIRRPDPRYPGGETPLDEDPLASAFWIRGFRREDASAVREVVFGVLAEFGLAPDHADTDVDLLRSRVGVAQSYQFKKWVRLDGWQAGKPCGSCRILSFRVGVGQHGSAISQVMHRNPPPRRHRSGPTGR
jgi:hypothetical protein